MTAAVAVPVVLALTWLVSAEAEPELAVPATVSLVVLAVVAAGWPRTRRLAAPLTAAVALLSLAGTAVWLAGTTRQGNGGWLLMETAALMVLAVLIGRWSPRRSALTVLPLVICAEAVLILPIEGRGSTSWVQALASSAFWALAAVVGAGAGWYLRRLDARRAQAVRDARRDQRFHLATDLHDFVAHDVSAMVVQAQAARLLLAADPDEAARFLARIEADGTRALSSMDRTIRMLRDLDGEPPVDLPGVGDLPSLVERFAATHAGTVELVIEPDVETALRWDASGTAYRIVVEALTNVRRHAGARAAVTVTVVSAGERVAVTVANAGDARPRPRSGTGLGLAGLAERVAALGGEFTARPVPPDGWQVRAELERVT